MCNIYMKYNIVFVIFNFYFKVPIKNITIVILKEDLFESIHKYHNIINNHSCLKTIYHSCWFQFNCNISNCLGNVYTTNFFNKFVSSSLQVCLPLNPTCWISQISLISIFTVHLLCNIAILIVILWWLDNSLKITL